MWNLLSIAADCSHPLKQGKPSAVSLCSYSDSQPSPNLRVMTFSATSQSRLDKIWFPPLPSAQTHKLSSPKKHLFMCSHTPVSKHSIEISPKDWDAVAATSQWPMRRPDCLCIAAERGLDILSARQSEEWQQQTMRHFLFAFCWLLISVSDSADVEEILGHWVGCAAFFFSLCLSPSPHSLLSPLPPFLLAASLFLS